MDLSLKRVGCELSRLSRYRREVGKKVESCKVQSIYNIPNVVLSRIGRS